MKYNLEGKIFAPISSTGTGEVDDDTLFHYHQKDNLVWAEYEGGPIFKGHLIAKIMENGNLDMQYQHINTQGELMFGKCISTPEKMPDGRLKLNEKWQWLSGDKSSGYSEIIEVADV